MDYRPSQPEHNVNVSEVHPLKEFFSLLAGLILFLTCVYLILGLVIDYTVDHLSVDTELALMESLDWEDFSSMSESESEQYLETRALLESLFPCADISYPVALGIHSSPEVNAFAMPGGYMVVNQGLLDKVTSENGLAFVLAHELAHFRNRDHLRSMGRSIVLLTGSILLTGNNSDLSSLIGPTMNLEVAQFSQARESLADRTALDILNCRYGHTAGAEELFEYLQETEEEDLRFSHYFSSHPQTETRIEQIRAYH